MTTVREQMIEKFGPAFDRALISHKRKEIDFLENILKALDKGNNIFSNETCELIKKMHEEIVLEIKKHAEIIEKVEKR